MAPFVQVVGVDHRRVDVFVTEKLLDRAGIITPLKEWVANKWQQGVNPGSSPGSLWLTGVDLCADIATRSAN